MKNKRNSNISHYEISNNSIHQNLISNLSRDDAQSNNSSDSSSDSDVDTEPPKLHEELDAKRKSAISSKKSVITNPIEKFLAQNPDLTELTLNDCITEDHDICVLDVPSNIDFQSLLGKSVNFERKTKIKLNKMKYKIQPCTNETKPINFLTNKLQVVHPIAYLKLHEYTKIKHDNNELNINKTTPAMPENLKVRHPLFGAEYENKIVLDERVEKKLDNLIESTLKKMKKKKKQKKLNESKEEAKHKQEQSLNFEKTGNEESNEVRESIFALLETHLGNQKKSRNIKEELPEHYLNTSDGEVGKIEMKEEITQNELNSDSPRKSEKNEKKKRKKNKETVVNESQDGILDTDNDSSPLTKKQRKRLDSIKHGNPNFVHDSNENDYIDNEKQNKHETEANTEKRGKKRKRQNSLEMGNSKQFDSFEQYFTDGEISRKERKRLSSIKNEKLSKLDEDEISIKKKKHDIKKALKERSQEESLRDDEVNKCNNNETELEKKYKKKNKGDNSPQEGSTTSDWSEVKKNGSDGNEETENGMKKAIKRESSGNSHQSNIVNSTVISGMQLPLFEFDMSRIGNKEPVSGSPDKFEENEIHNQKKKKKKSDSFNNSKDEDKMKAEEKLITKESEHSHSTKKQSGEDDRDSTSPTKKKRKKKEATDGIDLDKSALIASLLSKVKSDIKQKNKKTIGT